MKIMRNMVLIVLAIVMAATMFTCSANAECESISICGEASFVLSNSSYLMGIKEACEDVKILTSYQYADVRSPAGVQEDGRVIRYKGMAKVSKTGCGMTTLNVSISICQVDLVKEIVARIMECSTNEVELTAQNIIAASIFRRALCEENDYAAHVFFLSKQEKITVGKVIFSNGRWATLYAGRLPGTCDMYLGFAAGIDLNGGGSREEQQSFTVTVEEHVEETVTYTYDRTITIEGTATREIIDQINEGIYDGEWCNH